MRRCSLLLIALWASVWAGGCASSSKGELSKLRRRLAELAQNDSATQRRVEELNNRLFLLEDKVDTTRVASARVQREPRLPVVRIRPGDVDPEADDGQAAVRVAPPVGRQTRTIHDAEPAEPSSTEPSSAGAGVGPGDGRRSLVAAQDVSYGGRARGNDGPRPVLRLHGEGRDVRVDSPSTAKRRRPESKGDGGFDGANEKLPVVPVPSRAAVAAVKLYSKAMKQYQSGRYSAAADAFRGFLGSHGRHAYADNALYWLGECFYDLKKFRLALKMFRRVVEQYPNGNKAPDALLKMGYCYMRLQERANARNVLAQVVEIFPKSNSARLASSALTRLQ